MKRLALFAALASLLVIGVASAQAAPTPLPAHVYAPYFETWTTDSLTTTAQQSGARYFTLAFLETVSKTSRTATTSPTSHPSERSAGTSSRPSAAGARIRAAPRLRTRART